MRLTTLSSTINTRKESSCGDVQASGGSVSDGNAIATTACAGISKETAVPRSGREIAEISPPINSTNFLEIDKPKPAPPNALLVLLLLGVNASNNWSN